MSRSQGTKDTQGVNGDAANLQRALDAAGELLAHQRGQSMNTHDQPPACPYPHHRRFDWLGEGVGLIVCGFCHPPAAGLEGVVRRGGPGWNRELRARAPRIAAEQAERDSRGR